LKKPKLTWKSYKETIDKRKKAIKLMKAFL
jgi:hypothetical protein